MEGGTKYRWIKEPNRGERIGRETENLGPSTEANFKFHYPVDCFEPTFSLDIRKTNTFS